MKAKRSKYDTNPLDEKVADHAEDSWGSSPPDASTGGVSGATREIRGPQRRTVQGNSESEAPTRRIDEKAVTSYPSVFIPPVHQQSGIYQPPRVPPPMVYQPPPVPPPGVYQPPPMPVAHSAGSAKVSGLGIPEKWAVILPYLPFYLAIVAAIVELLLVPRTETRVRFHAAQGLALQIGITIVSSLLTLVGLFSTRFSGATLFSIGATVFLVVSMIRVWQGKPHHIAPLDEATKWLDDKINPRK